MKTKTSHGVRSPMQGFTPPMKTPPMPSGGGNMVQGHTPKSAPIQSPLNAPAKPGKK